MVQSINSKALLTVKANSFHSGLGSRHGDVLIGDAGFEFFNERNVADFVQIPWAEVDYVTAPVMFGKIIRSFEIHTKKNGTFTFTTKESGKILKVMRDFVPPERLLRAVTLSQKIKHLFKKK